jgi:hypothetical protein
VINLSEIGRNELYSPLETLLSLRDPDLYIAEDIADFRKNAPKLPYPWYKKFPFEDRQIHRAYIIVRNVGIRSFYDMKKEEAREHFIVHDATEQAVMNWGERIYFPPLHTFDEAHKQDGLSDNDWVYDVLFIYLITVKTPLIIQVRKFNFSRIKRGKTTLLDKVRQKIPELVPAPIPESI